MQLTQLLGGDGDERAATPVVGIVLMVAIAVILAGLISPELLSLSRQSGEAGPSAVVEFDYDTSAAAGTPDSWSSNTDGGDGLLTLTHAGGEGIPVNRLTVVGASSGTGLAFSAASGSGLADGEFDSGDELSVWVNEDDTVRVVWDSREGTKTTAVATWDST